MKIAHITLPNVYVIVILKKHILNQPEMDNAQSELLKELDKFHHGLNKFHLSKAICKIFLIPIMQRFFERAKSKLEYAPFPAFSKQ